MTNTHPTESPTKFDEQFVTKKMYFVEKFLPPDCPKCRQAFKEEGKDWVRLLGDILEGKKSGRVTEGYQIMVCKHCENYTAQFLLDNYTISDKEEAVRLCREEGYVNLKELEAFGTSAVDTHTIYVKTKI